MFVKSYFIFLSVGRRFFAFLMATLLPRRASVSYTHLDVYKRQAHAYVCKLVQTMQKQNNLFEMEYKHILPDIRGSSKLSCENYKPTPLSCRVENNTKYLVVLSMNDTCHY